MKTYWLILHLFFSFVAKVSCSESEVGWTVKDRDREGTANAAQTWVTPIRFPCQGVLTHWRYWAGRSAPFRGMVLRNVDNGGTLYDIIGINGIPASDIEQVVTYEVPADKRINVLAGDVIGFAWNSPIPKHINDGDHDDDDVVRLKKFSMRPPDDLKVNERINASAFVSQPTRAYSIQAIVSGIFTITIIIQFICSDINPRPPL